MQTEVEVYSGALLRYTVGKTTVVGEFKELIDKIYTFALIEFVPIFVAF